MKTLLQMEMYYVREYTSTCRILKIIYSWSVFSITYWLTAIVIYYVSFKQCFSIDMIY
jgi:hypothetical protein